MVGNERHPPPENIFPLPGKSRKSFPDIFHWVPDNRPLTQEEIVKGIVSARPVKNEQASCGGASMMVPLLKHWTALPAISYFLTNAMHVRESSRRITTPSTFKPPPRVTLTDAKRESWLKDLAKPSIPLRKLARTIPHGISNGVLLDQILSKHVPVNRAVWLVRCVGANEVRTLKRKLGQVGSSSVSTLAPLSSSSGSSTTSSSQSSAGFATIPGVLGTPSSLPSTSPGSMSGSSHNEPDKKAVELTWLSEWTEELLGYLEKVISDYNQSNPEDRQGEQWKYRMAYIIELVSQLYYESLLDRRAFLDWVSSSIRSAKSEWLPVLLLIVDSFWEAITKPPYVTKLIEALGIRYTALKTAGHTEAARIVHLPALRLFNEFKDAFVIPTSWHGLEVLLNEIHSLNAVGMPTGVAYQFKETIQTIRARNEVFIIQRPLEQPNEWLQTIKIAQILHDFREPYNFTELANDVRAVSGPATEMLLTVFRWTVDKGNAIGSYLCLALMERFQTMGIEVQDAFITFLLELDVEIPRRTVHDIFTGLYTRKMLRIDLYFRRLISSGKMHFDNAQKRAQLAVIRNLPFRLMPAHLISQAQIFLRTSRAQSSQRVDAYMEQFFAEYNNGQDTDYRGEPDQVTKNDELVIAERIYKTADRDYNDAKLDPRRLIVAMHHLENLMSFEAMSKILVMVLSTVSDAELYFVATRLFMSRFYFFHALRTAEVGAELVYLRADELGWRFPTTEDGYRVAKMVSSIVKSQRLKSYLAERFRVHYNAPDIDQYESGPAKDEEKIKYIGEVKDALQRKDMGRLSALRHAGNYHSFPFDSIVATWVRENPNDIRNVLDMVANRVIGIAAIDQKVNSDSLLLELLFKDISELHMSRKESNFLLSLRRLYLLMVPIDRVWTAMETIEDTERLIGIVDQITQYTVRDPSRLFAQILSRELSRGGPISQAATDRVICFVLGIESDWPGCRKVEALLSRCNGFNLKFCQTALVSILRDSSEEEIVGIIVQALRRTTVPNPAWRSVLNKLSPILRTVLLEAVVTEFHEDPAVGSSIRALSDVFDSLASFAEPLKDQEKREDSVRAVLESTNRLLIALCDDRRNPEDMFMSLQLLVKIVFTFHGSKKPQSPSATSGVVSGTDTSPLSDMELDSVGPERAGFEGHTPLESSTMFPRLIELFYEMEKLPMVREVPQTMTLIKDVLKYFEPEAAIPPPVSIKPAPLDDLMLYSRSHDTYTAMETWPIDLIEDANSGQGINDVAIDLARFETYLEIKDPS